MRDEILECFADEGAPQILRERISLANREDAGFRAWMLEDRSDIARGEDEGVGFGLEGLIDGEKALRVGFETGLRNPNGCSCAGDPKGDIERNGFAGIAKQKVRFDFCNAVPQVDVNAALAENASKLCLHAPIVRRQNMFGVGDKMKFNSRNIRLALQSRREAKLGAEREFDSARAAANDGHAH